MSNAMAEAILSGVLMAVVAGVLVAVVRGFRWMTRADERDEKARREWEKRCRENPGLEERAATATLKNPLGDLTWDDIKPLENSDGSDPTKSPSEYEELAKQVEQKTSDLVRRGTAVASGAVKGVSSNMPRWLKVVLFIVAGWIVLAIIGALSSGPRYPY